MTYFYFHYSGWSECESISYIYIKQIYIYKQTNYQKQLEKQAQFIGTHERNQIYNILSPLLCNPLYQQQDLRNKIRETASRCIQQSCQPYFNIFLHWNLCLTRSTSRDTLADSPHPFPSTLFFIFWASSKVEKQTNKKPAQPPTEANNTFVVFSRNHFTLISRRSGKLKGCYTCNEDY